MHAVPVREIAIQLLDRARRAGVEMHSDEQMRVMRERLLPGNEDDEGESNDEAEKADGRPREGAQLRMKKRTSSDELDDLVTRESLSAEECRCQRRCSEERPCASTETIEQLVLLPKRPRRLLIDNTLSRLGHMSRMPTGPDCVGHTYSRHSPNMPAVEEVLRLRRELHVRSRQFGHDVAGRGTGQDCPGLAAALCSLPHRGQPPQQGELRAGLSPLTASYPRA